MPNVSEIDLSSYIPVKTLPHYAQKQITAKGSIRDVRVLSSEAKSFIAGLGVDVSLWDGEKGTFGRAYHPSRENSQVRELSVEKIRNLRSRYIDLKRSTYVETSRCQLRKELEAQTRIQAQLDQSVLDVQEKITRVRQRMLSRNNSQKQDTVADGPLFKLLKKLESDLASSKRAADTIEKKISQTASDISETEYAFLRRYALLWCIVKGTSVQVLRKCAYSSDGTLVSQTASAKKESEIIWRRTLQVKSCYIDCKSGLSHLYKTEATLKAILEHLQAADNSLKGLPSSSSSPLPSAVNVDFRLSYAKKLWNSVNAQFRQATPYLQLLRLNMNFPEEVKARQAGTITEIFEDGGAQGGVTSIFENPDGYGTFTKESELLSKYEEIEQLHPLNRTRRIAALHKHARASYKFINKLYDLQAEMVHRAMAEIRRMEAEDIAASENLVSLWEQLLAISTENM